MKRLLLLGILIMCLQTSFSQKPCSFCDTLAPYKHHLSVQANRTFHNFRDFSTYLLELATGTGDRQKAYVIDLRYGYRVHKNIEVGTELIYNNYTSKFSNENNEELEYPTNKFKAGLYSRFIINKWQIIKPYADLGLGYFLYGFKAKEVNKDQYFTNTYLHKFDIYSVLGISFMIWKNHINIDLGTKYSPIRWSNVENKKLCSLGRFGTVLMQNEIINIFLINMFSKHKTNL